LLESLENKAYLLGSNIAVSIADLTMVGEWDKVNSLFSEVKKSDKDVEYIFFVGTDGRCVVTTLEETKDKYLNQTDYEKRILETEATKIEKKLNKKDIFEVISPVISSSSRMGILRIGYTLKNIRVTINHLILIAVIISIAGIIIGAIIYSIIIKKNVVNLLIKFKDLFGKAVAGDLSVRYDLSKVNCSEIKHCNQKECPEFGKDGVLCWLEAGSDAPLFGKKIVCPQILNNKIKSCKECEVYQKVCKNEIYDLAAYFNYFMVTLNQFGEIIKLIANDNIKTEELDKSLVGEFEIIRKTLVTNLRELLEIADLVSTDNLYSEKLDMFVKGIEQKETGITGISKKEMIVKKEEIKKQKTGDLSNAFINMINNLQNLAKQAEIIANDNLYNKELDIQVSTGVLGSAFSKMRDVLRALAHQAEIIANDDLGNKELDKEITSGALGSAFSKMRDVLRALAHQAEIIANDELYNKDLDKEITSGA